MQFTQRLRPRIRSGEITLTVRIWQSPRVKVGGRYRMGEGFVVVDRLSEISFDEITVSLARQTGFQGRADLLKVAKHGRGERVFVVEFHYEPPAAPHRQAETPT